MPTLDELNAAYARIAKRDWPPLHELARAAQQFELVMGTALRSLRHLPPELAQHQQHQQQPEAAAHGHRGPATAAARAAMHRPAPDLFDHKRAASGDRPDDD